MKKARRIVQGTFLALTLVGVFYLQANAECWCPFGGVEALYTYLREGNLLCSLGIANFYVLLALIASVLLVRRAFCGYLCPVGTISDWLGALGKRLGMRNRRVPASVDRLLSAAKYFILVVVIIATWQAGELVFRGYCPAYALLSRHGADITLWAYVSAGAVAIVSLTLSMPFCRWLCPLAAVVNPLSRFGIARIMRDSDVCSNCGRCAQACPMAIPVDRLSEVTASRCITCMNCIDACSSKAGPLSWGAIRGRRRVWPRAAAIGVLLMCAGTAVAAAYLAPWPSFIKSRGTPRGPIATVELRIRDLTCRGRANLLAGFLDRDDVYQISGPASGPPGFYRLEAWPDPGVALVRISYDSSCTDVRTIQRAITEPYFDMAANRWWLSPFVIDGYTPAGLDFGEAKTVR